MKNTTKTLKIVVGLLSLVAISGTCYGASNTAKDKITVKQEKKEVKKSVDEGSLWKKVKGYGLFVGVAIVVAAITGAVLAEDAILGAIVGVFGAIGGVFLARIMGVKLGSIGSIVGAAIGAAFGVIICFIFWGKFFNDIANAVENIFKSETVMILAFIIIISCSLMEAAVIGVVTAIGVWIEGKVTKSTDAEKQEVKKRSRK